MTQGVNDLAPYLEFLVKAGSHETLTLSGTIIASPLSYDIANDTIDDVYVVITTDSKKLLTGTRILTSDIQRLSG